jgi:hypothetical protein
MSTVEIKPDRKNANKGTARGTKMVESSLTETGAGRSIVIDAKGEIMGGNKTYEAAKKLGIPVRIVQSDGTELIAVQRTDLVLDDPNDPRGRKLAYYDNLTGQLMAWDAGQVVEDLNNGFNFEGLFVPNELNIFMALPNRAVTTSMLDVSTGSVGAGMDVERIEGGGGGNFDATKIAGAVEQGEIKYTYLIYVTFQDQEGMLEGLRLLSMGKRNASPTPGMRFASLNGEEFASTWRELLVLPEEAAAQEGDA